MEFAYVEKTGNISLNFENANEKGNELGQLIRKNAQGQEEVAVADILGLAAQAADPQSAAPYTVSLSDGAAWTDFDADFFAEAAVSIEGKGVEYSSGTIILAGDVESAAVTFAASHKTLELTLQNYTAPEKPVVPETEEGFAYRFYSESAAVEDILKECGIVSSYYNNVTVSDTALVTLDQEPQHPRRSGADSAGLCSYD